MLKHRVRMEGRTTSCKEIRRPVRGRIWSRNLVAVVLWSYISTYTHFHPWAGGAAPEGRRAGGGGRGVGGRRPPGILGTGQVVHRGNSIFRIALTYEVIGSGAPSTMSSEEDSHPEPLPMTESAARGHVELRRELGAVTARQVGTWPERLLVASRWGTVELLWNAPVRMREHGEEGWSTWQAEAASAFVVWAQALVGKKWLTAFVWRVCHDNILATAMTVQLMDKYSDKDSWVRAMQHLLALCTTAGRAAEIEGGMPTSDRKHPANVMWRKLTRQHRPADRAERKDVQLKADVQRVRAGGQASSRAAWKLRPGMSARSVARAEARVVARERLLLTERQRFDARLQRARDKAVRIRGGVRKGRCRKARRVVSATMAALLRAGGERADILCRFLTMARRRLAEDGAVQAINAATRDAARMVKIGKSGFLEEDARGGAYGERNWRHVVRLAPLGIPKFEGKPESWEDCLLPANRGRRHDIRGREKDVKRMKALGMHKVRGTWLVSPRKVVASVARKGIPVEKDVAAWGKRAVQALGGTGKMYSQEEPAPTMCAAASQLLYVWRNTGRRSQCVALAVEEQAEMLRIPLEWEPLQREVMGRVPKYLLGPGETNLSPLQSWAALSDSMHVGAVEEVIKAGWKQQSIARQEACTVYVHSSHAGLVNAFHLAVVGALSDGDEDRVQLAVATERAASRRAALRRMYPEAKVYAEATDPEAFRHYSQVGGITWSCTTYSSAGTKDAEVVKEWEARAWQNTELAATVLARFCTQTGGPPWMLVMENVPGLVELQACRPMLRYLLSEMLATPYVWSWQYVCPVEHCGGCTTRRRLFFVGRLGAPRSIALRAGSSSG